RSRDGAHFEKSRLTPPLTVGYGSDWRAESRALGRGRHGSQDRNDWCARVCSRVDGRQRGRGHSRAWGLLSRAELQWWQGDSDLLLHRLAADLEGSLRGQFGHV